MKITFSRHIRQGIREENQDRTGSMLDEHKACFLVCDGVAGLPGGKFAAQLVQDTLLDQLNTLEIFTPQSTASALTFCQQRLHDQQKNNPDYSRMCTTIAALFIDRTSLRAWWAHAGDSRIYHFRRGSLNQMTRDHSLAQRFTEDGYENTGINSNLLYHALGAKPIKPATFSEPIELIDGDAFLVCTDGFWLHLTSKEMEQSLRMVNACDQWLTLMLNAVNRTAGDDNLSAITVWIGEPEDATLLWSHSESARFLPSIKV